MKLRAITGLFFIIVMLGSVLLGHLVFEIFYLALSAFCLMEFHSNVKKSGIKLDFTTAQLGGMLVYFQYTKHRAFNDYPILSDSAFSYLFLIFILILIVELFKKNEKPFTNVAYTLLGVFFTIVPFTFFHEIAYVNGSYNFHFPLAFLLMLWANDTGAYLVGSKFGRTKLFERHSPKKTWEGFIGGVLITAGVAYIINYYYKDISLSQWIIMGVLISCFGTIGDLIESMFKRSINIKDSGGILPGHGGLLDRFDGLLIAAPIVYIYLHSIFKFVDLH
ncbi:MAG: phosphatidate cytidylyltransferase [Sphingobacteriaceae bacterium]|nr:MAG: phosphatidate cytidylyltransferase [Sphingobacteriaceae bacterium]